MKTKILLGLLSLLITTTIFAQKPAIKFVETTHDFGTISEEDDKVTHVFEFTNTGTSDLVLTNVQASCGCTTPQWVREPVPPKQKGTITVTYRAAGRPGPFTKSITVSGNADKEVLFIKGVVTPRGQRVENAYPILRGDIRLNSETLDFEDISAGKSNTVKLPIANISKKDILVTFVNLPNYITSKPVKLKAEEKSNITLTFDASKTNKWGKIEGNIVFITGDINNKNAPKQSIKYTSKIFEQFTQEQISNPPIIKMANEIVAGEVLAGQKKTVLANFENIGKVPLFIRAIEGADENISINFSAKAVKPGKKGKLKITLNATKLEANDYAKTITIMSNDPKNVNKHFILKYKVVK